MVLGASFPSLFPVFSQEGDTINVDVTCPGATLALAMIYLKTNNRYRPGNSWNSNCPAVGCAEVWNCWDVTWNPFSFAMPCRSIADWLKAPDTMYLLDFVKPEFLLLRVRFSLASFLCLFK